MKQSIKSSLSKINFKLGRNPIIERKANYRDYVPEPYQSVFTLSADFELAWAWRFSKGYADPLLGARERARLARRNMPKILKLCDTYQIPVTWATVGHLFLEECQKKDHLPHPELERIPHFENDYWRFTEGDWFQHDPCTNYRQDPEWYCPDLLDQIQNAAVAHEIACHTFSHIDCRDEVCPPEVFATEISQCQKLAHKRDVELKTLIYPAHTVGNLDTLAQSGFTNFRSNIGNQLAYPVKHQNGLWEIKSSYHLELRPYWSDSYQIKRACTVIDRAIENHSCCHFWFHPSFPERYLQQILPDIFAYLHHRRDDMLITTMDKYVDWLNEEIKTGKLPPAIVNEAQSG